MKKIDVSAIKTQSKETADKASYKRQPCARGAVKALSRTATQCFCCFLTFTQKILKINKNFAINL